MNLGLFGYKKTVDYETIVNYFDREHRKQQPKIINIKDKDRIDLQLNVLS